jgi:4-carboxymuconolactone decarboxylase
MARIPYATAEQYEELMQYIRLLPEEAAPTNSLRMLAHAPIIGGSVLRLIYSILAEANVDFSLRELAILRVTHLCQARHTWIQHSAIARTLGVSDAQIAALESEETPAGLFSDREHAVIAFTDEVMNGPRVSDRTFATVQKELSWSEVVELLLTIGYFRMIGSLLTNLDLYPACAPELLELAAGAID